MGVVHPPLEASLDLFLVQVMIILVLVRVLGFILKKIKQPPVIGEIVAGIMLGPSVMGYIPGFTETIFPQKSLGYINMFASVGLIFFMFFLGMEVEIKMMKKMWRTSLPVAVVSVLVPFAMGAAISHYIYDLDAAQNSDFVPFLLFVCCAFSFTALPVLARILVSCDLLSHTLGIQTLGAAAVNDVMAWCTLALALSYSNGDGAINGLYVMLIAAGFLLTLIFIVKPLIKRYYITLVLKGDDTNRVYSCLIFLLLCLSSWFADVIGIDAFFGAFAFGIIVPRRGNFIHSVAPKIELLIVEFFLPLYFAKSGLATNIGALATGELWGACILVCVLATVSKVLPITLLCRLFFKEWRFCVTMGVLMNTRGLVALIALNIGLERGLITDKIFTIMVIMALFTTFITPPLVWMLYLTNPITPTPAYFKAGTPEHVQDKHEHDLPNGVIVEKIDEGDEHAAHRDATLEMEDITAAHSDYDTQQQNNSHQHIHESHVDGESSSAVSHPPKDIPIRARLYSRDEDLPEPAPHPIPPKDTDEADMSITVFPRFVANLNIGGSPTRSARTVPRSPSRSQLESGRRSRAPSSTDMADAPPRGRQGSFSESSGRQRQGSQSEAARATPRGAARPTTPQQLQQMPLPQPQHNGASHGRTWEDAAAELNH